MIKMNLMSNKPQRTLSFLTNSFLCMILLLEPGRSLRELQYHIHLPYQPDRLHKYVIEKSSWAIQSLDSLVQRIESVFKSCNLLVSYLRNIPAHRRPQIDTKSRKKTAKKLAYHMQCRMSYLCSLSRTQLFEQLLSLDPHFCDFKLSNGLIVACIIKNEYGFEIYDAVVMSLLSRLQKYKDKVSAKGKEDRKAAKLEEIQKYVQKLEKLDAE